MKRLRGCVSDQVWGCTPPAPLPWREFLTHACKNITFPQLRLRTVTRKKTTTRRQAGSQREPILLSDVAHLTPATKLGQGYIFTGVCDSVNGGVSSRETPPPGRSPLCRETPPGRETPLARRTPLAGRTPPLAGRPPLARRTPPQARRPPPARRPPRAGRPPPARKPPLARSPPGQGDPPAGRIPPPGRETPAIRFTPVIVISLFTEPSSVADEPLWNKFD